MYASLNAATKIMKNFIITSIFAISTGIFVAPAYAATPEESAQELLTAHLPGVTGFAYPKVEKIVYNTKKKTVEVKCNDGTAYIPLTADDVEQIKADFRKSLPAKYKNYKIAFTTKLGNLDRLARFAPKTVNAPTEKDRFITPTDGRVKAPKGLDGSNIALWQSHGWYFEPKLNRWEWQRARVHQTVEDLYTQSYVMPFLMPMLENAGAYVMSPRERDIQLSEYIVDNDSPATAYAETTGAQPWTKTSKPGFKNNGELLTVNVNPFREGSARQVRSVADASQASTASWNADIAADGDYAVYVSYQSLPKSTKGARYTVNAANGPHHFTVNQQMGGGTWIYLGHFPLAKGKQALPIVELTNVTDDHGTIVTADAVKIGGGIGNVARIVKEPLDSIDYQYVSSGYPRFTEGARYFLQWAGAPESVYTPSDNENDYGDDYRSRGLWVNWLAGGSSVLPKEEGLGIPVDLSFAFHSDAGTTLNDSIIGSLGIYCTKGDRYANGTDRLASRDYTDLVLSNIVDDVRATFEPDWTRRGMWDQSYFEARVPEVPAMLLELLSHQNFADMKYGLDPAFRFVVSRAIYKGMLEFLARRDGREFVVQPLPVNSFAINGTSGSYTLSWKPTDDRLEPTAAPTYYIIEERIGSTGNAFREIGRTAEPAYTVTVSDRDIHSYRVIAGNDGGNSFPSEVLALSYTPGAKQVLVVNGFTRVSAPDWFDSGEIAGFYDTRDPGVPYLTDISYIGSQFEFRRNIPWMDDDAAGFGASRSNYERTPVAGNTFDYCALHGEAIVKAGYSFISQSAAAFAASGSTDAIAVDLILGKQKEIKQGRGVYGTRFKTFPTELQNKLRAYTSAGGNVFVSGSFIATDLWDNPNSDEATAEADQKFATEVLGYHWRVGQASTEGQAYEVGCRFKAFTGGEYDFYNSLNPDFYAVESPDSFYGADKTKAATIMRYSENNLVAGTAYSPGQYRTVAIGFPFETIKDSEARNSLMRQILNFFEAK